MKIQSHHLFLFAIILLPLFFAGCQTTDGMGEDIENLGESIQD